MSLARASPRTRIVSTRASSTHLDDEGVTHYQLEYRRGPAVPLNLVREINAWRTLFHTLGWIGQDP
jgi:hypothetical protein